MFNKNKEKRRKRLARLRIEKENRKRYKGPDYDPELSNKKRMEMRRAARVYREHGDI